MKILVCIKQVPDSAQIRVHPVTNTIMRQGVPAIVNPYDLVALEEAAGDELHEERVARGAGHDLLDVALGEAAPGQQRPALVGAQRRQVERRDEGLQEGRGQQLRLLVDAGQPPRRRQHGAQVGALLLNSNSDPAAFKAFDLPLRADAVGDFAGSISARSKSRPTLPMTT